MKLPTLYSRASTGAVWHWTIEVQDENYRTIYGQESGKTTTSEWYPAIATNVGRANMHTAAEQACFIAEATWKKNQELGYFADVKDIDNELAHIEVMLANKYEKRKKYVDFKNGRRGLQCKLNGNRDAASIRGHMTRGGKMYTSVPHIVKELESFFEEWPEAVLDGELFNYELRQKLNELSRIIRRQNPSKEDLAKSEKLVRFYIYDGYGFAGMTQDTPYHIRKAWIDKNVIAKFKFVVEVPTVEVHSEAEMLEAYNKFLEDGQEGGILRNLEGGYEHKRSDNLLKVKPEDDDEGDVIEIIEGKGNCAGSAKNALIRWKGKEFEAVFMGSIEIRRQIWEERKFWKGRKNVTFLYMGLTGLGTPNYARIDPLNCHKGDR
jgi:DNA ligase-1